MLLRAGLVEGRLDAGVLSSGQVAGVIDDLPTVAELVAAHHDGSRTDAEASGRSLVSKTRVPAADGWFTMDEAAPQLVGRARHRVGLVLLADRAGGVGQPERARRGARAGAAVARGTLWSWTTNHYAPPEPYVSPDPFVPYTVCAVELDDGADGRARRGSRPAPTPTHFEVGMSMELVLGPLYEDDEHEYVVWQWAPRRDREARDERDHDIAILGVGMHPWGKWGRNFVEYGVVAAQAALADAGRRVARRPVRLRRRDRAQRLSRLRRGRDVRPGAGLERRAGCVVVRRVRLGRRPRSRRHARRSWPGSAMSPW